MSSPILIAALAAASLAAMLIDAYTFDRPPRQACVICAARSARHPSGTLKRYTTRRIHGHPVCRRHNLHDITTHWQTSQ